jgi:hypothetical protein
MLKSLLVLFCIFLFACSTACSACSSVHMHILHLPVPNCCCCCHLLLLPADVS